MEIKTNFGLHQRVWYLEFVSPFKTINVKNDVIIGIYINQYHQIFYKLKNGKRFTDSSLYSTESEALKNI